MKNMNVQSIVNLIQKTYNTKSFLPSAEEIVARLNLFDERKNDGRIYI